LTKTYKFDLGRKIFNIHEEPIEYQKNKGKRQFFKHKIKWYSWSVFRKMHPW